MSTTEVTPSKTLSSAKVENVSVIIDEMYKGSKQSYMTLNIHFIISQMMAVIEELSDDLEGLRLEEKAKTFYLNHSKQGFHLTENHIGLIYCLMMIISQKLISPSSGLEILTALSRVDSKDIFTIRQNVLDRTKSPDVEWADTVTATGDLFAPDTVLVNQFRLLTKNNLKQLPVKLDDILEDDIIDEKIILTPTPFEGDFALFYGALVGVSAAMQTAEKKDLAKENQSTKTTKKIRKKKFKKNNKNSKIKKIKCNNNLIK